MNVQTATEASALSEFLEAWSGGLSADLATKLTCTEADALARLLRTHGRPASSGTVKSLSKVDASAMGMYVRIEHSDGIETQYLHLSQVLVNAGDKVSAGQLIGEVGNTGRSYGAHLHFEVLVDGEYVDPLPFLQARGVDYCTLATPTGSKALNACRK